MVFELFKLNYIKKEEGRYELHVKLKFYVSMRWGGFFATHVLLSLGKGAGITSAITLFSASPCSSRALLGAPCTLGPLWATSFSYSAME